MSAATDYRNNLIDARNLLDLIRMELDARELEPPAKIDYGHVGDMSWARTMLRTTLAGIMGNADGVEILASIDEALENAKTGGTNMPAIKAQFRGHTYSHQQMEALIRALTASGYAVRQTSYLYSDGHECTLYPRGAIVGNSRAMNMPTRWKALAEAVRLLEQP